MGAQLGPSPPLKVEERFKAATQSHGTARSTSPRKREGSIHHRDHLPLAKIPHGTATPPALQGCASVCAREGPSQQGSGKAQASLRQGRSLLREAAEHLGEKQTNLHGTGHHVCGWNCRQDQGDLRWCPKLSGSKTC